MRTFNGKTARQIAAELQAKRTGDPSRGEVARRIHFGQFCRAELAAEPGKVLYDLGVNLSSMTVDAILSVDHDARYLVPEFFLEAIDQGFYASPWWTELMSGDVNVPNDYVNAPNFDIGSTEGPTEHGEGETISGDTISHSTRKVTLRKLARRLDVTYEAAQFSSIGQVIIWMRMFGAKLAQSMNSRAVERQVNGDDDAGTMAPATIGILSEADGFTYRDFLAVAMRLGKLGYPVTSVVADEEEMIDLLEIAEFKRLQAGAALTSLDLKTPVPAKVNAFCHAGVGSGKYMFSSQPFAAHSATCKPLTVETDKIITKQLETTVCSCIQDVVKLQRAATLIVDTSLVRVVGGANDFPAWMAAE